MDDLEYSNEALEAKGLFYNKEITVYVEGKDDPLFWGYIFDLTDFEAHVEDVGGNLEIEKYMDKIINEDVDFYVATDNDHSDFLDETKNHERIVRTYGYSIENSMYNMNTVQDIISKLSKQKVDILEELGKWSKDFSKKVYDLLILDIANHKYNKGVSIFGDNCFRLLKSQRSHEICEIKTQAFIDSVKQNFTEDELKEVRNLVKQSEKDVWFLIKGHFITNALINLIKNKVRRESGSNRNINTDSLYALTIDCTTDWENKIDIKHIVKQINSSNKSA